MKSVTFVDSQGSPATCRGFFLQQPESAFAPFEMSLERSERRTRDKSLGSLRDQPRRFSDFSTPTTSSYKALLHANPSGPQIVSSPFHVANLPPASRRIGGSGAQSHG